MNVALYRKGRDRWAMTERGRSSLSRDQNTIAIGPSAMHWDGAALRIEIDEWTAPLPSRVRGSVTLRPQAIHTETYALDAAGKHHWRPIAPRARVDVRFDGGALDWSGAGYFDHNFGEEALERGFRSWHWSRAHTHNGTHIYYDIAPRHGADRSLALSFSETDAVAEVTPPPFVSLPKTFWGVQRVTRGTASAIPHLVRTLEDAPFYARSQLGGIIDGARANVMHESLSLDRFRTPVVRAMLPFRMPRIIRRA